MATAEERSSGIIVRTRLLTETSLIVHWVTPEFGRIATVAKGARRPKSPFRGKLDLFYEADFSFLRSRRSDLHTLKEAVLRQTHPSLRRDLARLQQAAYAASLIEQATETDTPLPNFHALLRHFLAHLDHREPDALPLVAFEARLLVELGLSPAEGPASLTAGTRQILSDLIRFDWAAIPVLKPSPAQLRELTGHLSTRLLQHLDRLPRGRHAAYRG